MLLRRCVWALALLCLAACSGDERNFKAPTVEDGLAVEDFGLTPDDPAPLEAATAWLRARDADGVDLLFAGAPEDDFQAPEFDAERLDYERRPLRRVDDPDARGFARWEADLPRRGENEVLLYFFELQAGADSLSAPPEGRRDPVAVAARPIVVDFEVPPWPPLSRPIPCHGDPARILDGAEDQGTLAGAPVFDVIRTPDWRKVNRASILGNLAGVTRGIGVEWGGEAWFFPLAILLWNEVSNQRLGDEQTALTYCPLTDTALLFDTGMDPEALPKWHDFEPTGLYNSNLSVSIRNRPEDRRTIFNQMLGFGFVGPQSGECLSILPSYLVEFSLWERLHPDTWVLEGDPDLAGFDWDSRENPYETYWRDHDEIRAPVARTDERFPAKSRVMGLLTGTDPVVVPLGGQPFVHHTRAAGLDVVVLHQRGTAIALEARHPVSGEPLHFRRSRATWRRTNLYEDDRPEPSLWTFEGVAIAGPLKGERLAWVPSMQAFWFAWYAIYPESRVEVPEPASEG